MNQAQFTQLSTVIDSLSPSQRHQLLDRLQHPEAIPDILEHLEQNLQSHLQWLRRFNGVATKYLPHYLGWFRWFDQQTSEISQPSDFMSDFISSEANQHLMRT